MEAIDAYSPTVANAAQVEPAPDAQAAAVEQPPAETAAPPAEPVQDPAVAQVVDEYV